MASLRGLRAYDQWDSTRRIRYGSKGRLSSTLVLGEPGTCKGNVFVPVTLSMPWQVSGEGRLARGGSLRRRLVGGAEVGTVTPVPLAATAPSAQRPAASGATGGAAGGPAAAATSGEAASETGTQGRGASGASGASSPASVRSRGVCGSRYWRPEDPHFPSPLLWWSETGMSDASPLSVHRAAFVDHSRQLAVAAPAATYRDLEKKLTAARALEGGIPFTANSTQRASFVDHGVIKEWKLACPPESLRAVTTTPASESCGSYRRWSPEELANCRSLPTFTATHTTREPFKGPRPATLGRHIDWMR